MRATEIFYQISLLKTNIFYLRAFAGTQFLPATGT
jgi:hypothetical protein